MALKNVVIGYAKGDKGDKGDTGERGATGQTGPQGESGNIADAAITDTQGLDVAKGAKTTAQKLFDAIADRIVNKLVTNDTLTTKLADYLLKSAMSSTNINSTTNVPTSALVYSLLQDVNSALIYRGDITGDLNRASKNGITPGYYTVGNSSTISNGPKGIAWCPFIQFYDNFHTQMIIDTTGLFVRKFAGNPAAWIDWAQYSKS